MKSNGNNYCVILAGGKGRRLWPCSRSNYPKQFVDFFGVGRTQLQQTFDRMAKIVPADHIFINTNEEYVQLVKEQLPEVPLENEYWRNLFIAIRHLAWHGPIIASRCSILMPASSPLLRIRLSSMKMLSGKTYWKVWLLWQNMTVS